MPELKDKLKSIAKESGAALVGIASKDRLLDSPPSADPTYLLPSAQSIISFAVRLDKKIVRGFLNKKDWLSHCEERKQLARTLYGIGDRLVDFLHSRGFEALNVDLNNNYRPEPGARDVTEMTEFKRVLFRSGFEALNVDLNNNYRPEPGAREIGRASCRERV